MKNKTENKGSNIEGLEDNSITPDIHEKIHIMPQKFIKEDKKQDITKIFMWVAIIFALIAAGITAFVFVNKYLNSPAKGPEGDSAEVAEIEEKAEAPIIEEIKEEEIIEEPIVIEAEEEEEEDTGAEVEIDEFGAVGKEPEMPTGAEDEDGDGLTLNEEKLYATNSLSSDTDGDGYSDGEEVKAGYDPRLPDKTLLESGMVKIYQNPFQNYSLHQPRNWLIKAEDSTGEQITIDTKMGEFITIIVKSNESGQNLEEWISTNDLMQAINELIPIKVKNLAGYKSIDGLKYYLISPGQETIYVFSYKSPGMIEVSFKTTFEMIVNSFNLVAGD